MKNPKSPAGSAEKLGSQPRTSSRPTLGHPRAASFAFIVLVLLSAAVRGGALQEESEPRLSISPTSGLPEAEVPVPLYLYSGGAAIGALSIDIEFPDRLVSFVKADQTFLSESVRAELQTRVDPGVEEGWSILKLTLATPDGDKPREFIPDGPIAFLTFRISKEASLNGEIVFQSRASGTTVDDPPRQVRIASAEGKLSVKSIPLTACFFYMH